MISKVLAITLQGFDALPVEVEAGVYRGLPDLTVVGLPDAVLRESRERVRSAVVNAGYQWPSRRMLVNLAPAHIRKEGSGLDLAVGVSLLKASGQLPELDTDELVFVGELSLDGTVRATRGVLAAALTMSLWPRKILVVPSDNLREAVRGTAKVMTVESLAQLRDPRLMGRKTADAYAGKAELIADCPDTKPERKGVFDRTAHIDLSMVRGQYRAKRALEIAAAGKHHLLLIGPPGSGKSLLARCLHGIMPPMETREALEVNRVYSVAGLLDADEPWVEARPFRSPHVGVTKAGLIGGGQPFRPGEVSLAHNGVLFIDELPEMNRGVLESLRQPLEEGYVTISRAWGSVTIPARIQLVASANPCPCGYYGEYPPKCKCLDYEIRRYQSRFSGPLLDRVDLVVKVPRLGIDDLTETAASGEDSAAVAQRVSRVWKRRLEEGRDRVWDPDDPGNKLSRKCAAWAAEAYEKYRLTARGYFRMLLLARTIADLSGEEAISVTSLAEALEYRLGFEELK